MGQTALSTFYISGKCGKQGQLADTSIEGGNHHFRKLAEEVKCSSSVCVTFVRAMGHYDVDTRRMQPMVAKTLH